MLGIEAPDRTGTCCPRGEQGGTHISGIVKADNATTRLKGGIKKLEGLLKEGKGMGGKEDGQLYCFGLFWRRD